MAVSSILSRGIIGGFYHRLEERTRAAWATVIGQLFASDQETETYPFLGHAPTLQEWLDVRGEKGLREDTISVTNKEYQATISVPRKWVKRDKTPQILMRVRELAARAATWWNKEVSSYIDNGTATTKHGAAYTGSAFFHTAHAIGDSGQTFDNDKTHACAAAAEPTTDEMIAAIFSTGIGAFLGMNDDEGEPWHEDPRDFTIMVPTDPSSKLLARAAEALNLSQSDAGKSNLLTSIGGYNWTLQANSRLTDASRMFIFRTDGDVRSMILQEEEAPMLEALAEGSEEEFKANRYLYGVRATRAVAYGYPQMAVTVDFT